MNHPSGTTPREPPLGSHPSGAANPNSGQIYPPQSTTPLPLLREAELLSSCDEIEAALETAFPEF